MTSGRLCRLGVQEGPTAICDYSRFGGLSCCRRCRAKLWRLGRTLGIWSGSCGRPTEMIPRSRTVVLQSPSNDCPSTHPSPTHLRCHYCGRSDAQWQAVQARQTILFAVPESASSNEEQPHLIQLLSVNCTSWAFSSICQRQSPFVQEIFLVDDSRSALRPKTKSILGHFLALRIFVERLHPPL
jgi:hypothetical protein